MRSCDMFGMHGADRSRRGALAVAMPLLQEGHVEVTRQGNYTEPRRWKKQQG